MHFSPRATEIVREDPKAQIVHLEVLVHEKHQKKDKGRRVDQQPQDVGQFPARAAHKVSSELQRVRGDRPDGIVTLYFLLYRGNSRGLFRYLNL